MGGATAVEVASRGMSGDPSGTQPVLILPVICVALVSTGQGMRRHPRAASQRMVMDVTRRVSEAMRRLQDRGAVKGEKDQIQRYVWRLA